MIRGRDRRLDLGMVRIAGEAFSVAPKERGRHATAKGAEELLGMRKVFLSVQERDLGGPSLPFLGVLPAWEVLRTT